MSVQVCSESTDHAEDVQKTYNPQQVEYGKLDLSHHLVKCAIPL